MQAHVQSNTPLIPFTVIKVSIKAKRDKYVPSEQTDKRFDERRCFVTVKNVCVTLTHKNPKWPVEGSERMQVEEATYDRAGPLSINATVGSGGAITWSSTERLWRKCGGRRWNQWTRWTTWGRWMGLYKTDGNNESKPSWEWIATYILRPGESSV